uniref:glycosyltransferase family 4 protein n=1 Tax=Algoriphagus sp. TaxID=1872435 RepID=UPI004048161B
MKIFFDHRIFFYQKYGGISRYYILLYENLKFKLNLKTKIKSFIYINSYLNQSISNDFKGIYLNSFDGNNKVKNILIKILNYLYEYFCLFFYKPNIYHLTYYDRIPFHFKKTKIIVTVYDMIHELYPNEFDINASNIKRKCISKADLVICISENTKADLLRLLDIDEKKVKVIYLGFSKFNSSPNKINFPILLNTPYILFVGQRSGYKNFINLVKAYASSPQLQLDYNLICFGGGVFDNTELEIIKSLNLKNKIFQLSGDDDMLNVCYQNAKVFVYPSLYEGFGIPPLEAMSCNTPVCCSNTSSIPEVVGEAAILFDPNDFTQIESALLKVLYQEDVKNRLILAGKQRINQFTWENCAQQTYYEYQKIL